MSPSGIADRSLEVACQGMLAPRKFMREKRRAIHLFLYVGVLMCSTRSIGGMRI